MTTSRKPLDGSAIAIMVTLCLLWGLQQVSIKSAAPDMGPVMQMALRSAIAAFLLWLLILVRGETFSMRRDTLRPGLGVGLLLTVEFLCIGLGLQYTTASHMSVFLYTAPIFTVLGLHWFIPTERLQRLQWAGVFIAFIGLAIAFSNGLTEQAHEGKRILLGDALAVGAGLSWAALTVVIRCTALSEAPPSTTLLYQLASAALLLLPAAALLGQANGFSLTRVVWASLLYQAVLVTFISFLVWYWMLRRYLASRMSVFSFLTPLFGVAFGVLLLHDPIGVPFAAGSLLVFAGVVMVNLRRA